MGNKESQPQFNNLLNDLKAEKYASKKLSIRPEQKYRQIMIEGFRNAKLPTMLKEKLQNLLFQKIQRAELISTVSVISTLMKNNYTPPAFQSTVRVEQQESRHVVINFNPERFKPNRRRKASNDDFLQSVILESLPERRQTKKSRLQDTNKRLKYADKLMRKELSKEYHPFNKLTKVFTDFLVKVFLTGEMDQEQLSLLEPDILEYLKYLKRDIKNLPKKVEDQEKFQQLLRKFIHQWCFAVNECCLKSYKKWVLFYTELPQKKYNKWISQIILDQIWLVNEGYLFQIVSLIIENNQPKIKIPGKFTDEAFITPSFFLIDEPLQIEGQYLNGILETSQFTKVVTPSQLLRHLQRIKAAICKDIDKYHDLQKKIAEQQGSPSKQKPVYEINSDNILGILSYVLYRVRNKIQEINRQIVFLRVLYGDNVYHMFDESSYMLSTISTSIEYLSSEAFVEALRDAKLNDDKKSTKVSNEDKSKEIQIEAESLSYNTQKYEQFTTPSKRTDLINQSQIGFQQQLQ